jgi:hypothetical protein
LHKKFAGRLGRLKIIGNELELTKKVINLWATGDGLSVAEKG